MDRRIRSRRSRIGTTNCEASDGGARRRQDRFPNCNRQQRSSGERPGTCRPRWKLPDCNHDRTIPSVLSSREAAIKSMSDPAVGRSAVSSSSTTHVYPDNSGNKSASIESPISNDANGWSINNDSVSMSVAGISAADTGQSGRRHWPHCQDIPSAFACCDPGRYSNVTENWPNNRYQRASIPSSFLNFCNHRRELWSVHRVVQ